MTALHTERLLLRPLMTSPLDILHWDATGGNCPAFGDFRVVTRRDRRTVGRASLTYLETCDDARIVVEVSVSLKQAECLYGYAGEVITALVDANEACQPELLQTHTQRSTARDGEVYLTKSLQVRVKANRAFALATSGLIESILL